MGKDKIDILLQVSLKPVPHFCPQLLLRDLIKACFINNFY